MTPTSLPAPIAAAGATLDFRPATDDDLPLLRRIYASVRSDELARVPHWSDAAKAAFLDQQFNAQHTYYHQVYTDADWLVVLVDNAPAGRLYLHRTPPTLHIIDIALLPEFRRRGLGTALLRALLDEAAATGRSVRIYVERMNPALRLYERLGFRVIDASNQVYLLMERK